MIVESWKVRWNEYSSDTYLYGSKIMYHSKEDIEYQNELIPSGTVIKQWYSKTNYQANRIEPALPIIDGESKYQIIINIDCPADEQYLVRLVFYDRYEGEAGTLTIREKSTIFQCPLKTYSYRLQLINGGMTKFHFHSIVIQEITDETDEILIRT